MESGCGRSRDASLTVRDGRHRPPVLLTWKILMIVRPGKSATRQSIIAGAPVVALTALVIMRVRPTPVKEPHSGATSKQVLPSGFKGLTKEMQPRGTFEQISSDAHGGNTTDARHRKPAKLLGSAMTGVLEISERAFLRKCLSSSSFFLNHFSVVVIERTLLTIIFSAYMNQLQERT